jgi:hypothetical protein
VPKPSRGSAKRRAKASVEAVVVMAAVAVAAPVAHAGVAVAAAVTEAAAAVAAVEAGIAENRTEH